MTRIARAALLSLLFASGVAQAADELGRLFFTPSERAALDARRKARVPDKVSAPVVASPVTRIDGYVKRSQGPSTVWMNGESLNEGGSHGPRIETRGPDGEPRVSVNVGEPGNRVRLKPGESLDRGTGEVQDVIGDGDIEVRRRAP
ncbi:MAG TPA: hypothetical protein VFV74_03975 [Burkholderiales bacterium]|nr:hypothetical protein [Burkholderiales bacterium]